MIEIIIIAAKPTAPKAPVVGRELCWRVVSIGRPKLYHPK